MTPYHVDPLVTVHVGDCLDVLPTLPSESVDSVVTDPPAGIAFMAKSWDRDKGGRTQWVEWMTSVMRECHRVLKPGGYVVVWSLPRTCHWTGWAIEDAGFRIVDQLAHVFASGFPKGKTQLKPAREDWWLARKPGALRPLGIDECRIGTTRGVPASHSRTDGVVAGAPPAAGRSPLELDPNVGRWPSNVLLSDPELFDEPNPWVVGSGASAGSVVTFEQAANIEGKARTGGDGNGVTLGITGPKNAPSSYGDSGGYSRFFIIPKADRAERERGLASLALRLHRERGECDKLPAWQRPDQSPSGPTDSSSRARGISDAPRPVDESSSSATSSPGKPLTDPSPRATRSTTSTATSRTTPSPTSSLSIPSATSESTPGASLSMGFGGSPAPSASSTDPSMRSGGTSPRRDGPSTDDADPATSSRWASRNACADCGKPLPRGSSHPTVKPIDLMAHLVKLVTPPGGTTLDPFAGSGTTALAASQLGFKCIAIEREPEYAQIIVGRLIATPMGLGLDVPAGTQRRAKLGKDKGGGTHCSFFPGKCEGHPGHGKYGPTIHSRREPAA